MYALLIKAYAVEGMRNEALAVYQRMSADGVEASTYTYTSLMSVCARANDRPGMLKYFDAMTQRGLKPEIMAWNVVLDYCAKMDSLKRVPLAKDVLERMQKQGYVPNTVSYTSFALALIRSGDIDGLDTILERTREEGTVRDTVLLNTLLDGYASTLRWDKALQLLESWTAEGVVADQTSYAFVIRACVRARKAKEARQVERLMHRAGLQPNIRIYSMLMTVHGKLGDVRFCKALLTQMREEGIRPNSYIYAGLMEACLYAGDPERAAEIFDQAEVQGIQLDATLYTLRIRAALSPVAIEQGSSTPDVALSLLEKMKSQGGTCEPNIVTYNALIMGLLDLDAPQQAVDVLEKMVEAGFAPDRKTYAALTGQLPHDAPAFVLSADVNRSAASTVVALRRAGQVVQKQRFRLGGEVYLAALAAAEETADFEAAAEFIEMRRSGLFHLRRAHEGEAAAAEARMSAPATNIVEEAFP
jgi:pentatricopeptide repeat protein